MQFKEFRELSKCSLKLAKAVARLDTAALDDVQKEVNAIHAEIAARKAARKKI